ncbi:hypothetical protein RchiOBHm_Chr6g0266521 [Rosa chinensis]|uniref:Uncharacterized protein n=1 Tax=Rosa chinensis TaxID=74649 RepID=A0A2P6PPS0_ROSCH|nr:hypothetical protein RchiOBHm_Chr6g0266521 [Rosa chinensis]
MATDDSSHLTMEKEIVPASEKEGKDGFQFRILGRHLWSSNSLSCRLINCSVVVFNPIIKKLRKPRLLLLPKTEVWTGNKKESWGLNITYIEGV